MGSAAVRYRSFVQDSARWEGFGFRTDDIVISTPPKCGTTWMQMMCALLIFQTPNLPKPLDELSPWLDMLTTDRDALVAELEAQEHRRFIKTHTPLDGLPYDERITYVCVGRDPRDVGLSWDNHLANIDFDALIDARAGAVGLDDLDDLSQRDPGDVPEDPVARFVQWVEDPTPPSEVTGSLWYTLHHLQSFWEARSRPNVVVFHYGDLEADLEREMRRLAARLGADVDEGLWPTLVDAATFDSMRSRADELIPVSRHAIWRDRSRFFNKGRSGQWRDLLGPQELERYDARVAELASPEIATWVHRGGAARN